MKKILARRVVEKTVTSRQGTFTISQVEYLVRWAFPDATTASGCEETWEAEANLQGNAHELLHEFLIVQPKQPGCPFGHLTGVCRCHQPLVIAGHDESIFKQYQKSIYQWVVKGIRAIRKKGDGSGEMVSGFKDEIRGFGCPLSPDELERFQAYRAALGKPPLDGSPAVRFLSYGKSRDGYWTYELFAEQVADVLDMYEFLYPSAQIALQVDWSSGHSKHRVDALNPKAMRVNFGGKQLVPHTSKLTEGCLGDGALLKVGELQYFYFRSAAERKADGATDGKPDAPPFYQPDLSPAEYVGKAKGKKQILYERGLYKPGMVESIDLDDPKGRERALSMDHVLSGCEDFRTETTALQALVEARGHILVMSPKGHCELAGEGIEYDWGRMKQVFRRKNKYVHFHELILDSMSRASLPLSTSRKFSRRARAYRRAYREGVDNEHTSIESMVRIFKTHRNAKDFAKAFIRRA